MDIVEQNKELIFQITDVILANMPNVNVEKLAPYERVDFEKTLTLLTELTKKESMSADDMELYSIYIDTLLNFDLINSKETMRIYIDSALNIAVSIAAIVGDTLKPGTSEIIETIGSAITSVAKESY
jgi:hypothetical protein